MGSPSGEAEVSRIHAAIHSDDPVVRAGMVAMLRWCPEIRLADDPEDPDLSVLVLCVDAVDDEALAAMRKWGRREGVRTVLVLSEIREAMAVPGLSDREIDLVRLLAQGYDTREIASRLNYSERTVKNVLHRLMTRLQLHNRAHVVAYAARQGYL